MPPTRSTTRVLLAIATFAVVLALPHLATAGSNGAVTDLGLGRQLAAGSLAAFAIALAGGVLTSLTPCVYPLIPITVSIFGARQAGSRRHAMALSGLYVLGIAVMYSALGATAALTGKAFGTVMQNPWVLGAVGVVFLAMAASMFGAFELHVPAGLQARLSRVGGAGHAGAFAMGLVAGIIAAPCTGPVLAAALAFVATQGSVAYGVAIMFTYAIGIGVPFFLLGAFSVSLPKSGPWMDGVKSAFGVALLALALVYLQDLVPGVKQLFSAAPGAVLAAAVTASAGVLVGALHGSFGGTRAHQVAKGLGVALVVGGIAYAVGAGNARSVAVAGELPWLTDEAEALRIARAERKPIVIDFWADWCTACKELDHTAWSDARVREEARRFVLLKLDGSESSAAVKSGAFDRSMEKYGVLGLPTVLFIDAYGRELPARERVTAAVSAEEMVRRLRSVDEPCAVEVTACLARW
jgi:thiol:disulfide interchange protein DsbD